MRRSREYARDYSSEWIELLIILFILTILGVAMYFSFRYDPNHTSTIANQNTSTLVASETSQSKSSSTAIKSAMQTQKISHMVPIAITQAPKVMQTSMVQLTPVNNPKKPSKNRTWSSKNVKLTRMRIPRAIRRIPEILHEVKV